MKLTADPNLLKSHGKVENSPIQSSELESTPLKLTELRQQSDFTEVNHEYMLKNNSNDVVEKKLDLPLPNQIPKHKSQQQH